MYHPSGWSESVTRVSVVEFLHLVRCLTGVSYCALLGTIVRLPMCGTVASRNLCLVVLLPTEEKLSCVHLWWMFAFFHSSESRPHSLALCFLLLCDVPVLLAVSVLRCDDVLVSAAIACDPPSPCICILSYLKSLYYYMSVSGASMDPRVFV